MQYTQQAHSRKHSDNFASDTLERYQRRSISTLNMCLRWLTSGGYSLELRNSASGQIPFSLRTYITLPDDSEIFSAVAGGNRGNMLELFQNGQATPFVRDRTGCSLLHVSHGPYYLNELVTLSALINLNSMPHARTISCYAKRYSNMV